MAILSKSKRFNEIFHIMLDHHLTSLVRGIASHAKARHLNGTGPLEASQIPEQARDVPLRVRRLLEDLGPTFIKIGQLLGTRPDLVPSEFIEEFKKMYDQTTPTPFSDVRILVERELGKPLGEVFRSFEETPIASASIAQVHRATLRDGTTVAVKAQHPGIEDRMRTDFEILRGIISFTERVFSATQVWQPAKHLEEVRAMLDKELDFRNELRVMQQVETNFREVPEVKIPHPYESLSTRRVLVMEFIHGTKFHQRGSMNLQPEDNRNLARIVTHAMAKQIFVDRLFHADPSPGNILLIDRSQICFLDFGAFGQVTKRRSRLILEFIQALAAGNLEETGGVIVDLCDVRREFDQKRFLFDLERILDYYEKERASPADPVLLEKVTDLANRHGMLLPADFMLITRALYQFDGMCKDLDRRYELVEVLKPYVHQTVREQMFNPIAQREQITNAAQDLAKLVTRLPAQVERILGKLEKGQFTSRLEVIGLEDFKRHRANQEYFLAFTLFLGAWLLAITLGYVIGGMDGLKAAAGIGFTLLLAWLLIVLVLRQRQQRSN